MFRLKQIVFSVVLICNLLLCRRFGNVIYDIAAKYEQICVFCCLNLPFTAIQEIRKLFIQTNCKMLKMNFNQFCVNRVQDT